MYKELSMIRVKYELELVKDEVMWNIVIYCYMNKYIKVSRILD